MNGDQDLSYRLAAPEHGGARSGLRSPRKSCSGLKHKQTPKRSSLTDAPSPLLAIGLAEFDPFQSTAASITPYMSRVLEFYSGAMHEKVFPSRILADVSRQCTLSYASQDPVALNAIVCTTAGACYAHYGDIKHGYAAMHFKGEAIRCLKQELTKSGKPPISVSTLYAVSLLLWVECLQGDVEAVEAHVRGLDQLMLQVEGVRTSPLPIMTTILACSYYCAAMTGTRPVLEPIIRCEDRISSTTLEAVDCPHNTSVGSMAGRFFAASNALLIGPQLLHLISEQRKCIAFKELCTLGVLNPPYDDIQYIYSLQVANDYELLMIPFNQECGEISPVQEALRLVLYIFAQPIIAVASPKAAFSRSMVRQLQAALECSECSTLWQRNFDLLLWVLFIGAHISYGEKEWDWFLAHIAMITRVLGIRSANEVKGVLSGFYYFPKLFDGTMEIVWKDTSVILQSDSA